MASNRSVPVDTILPHVIYRDVAAAIDWLTAVFGFVEHYHYGEPAQGAQMRAGNGYIMLAQVREGRTTPAACGGWTQMLTVFVDDVEAHYRRAKAAGAEISEEMNEPFYGERQYAALDLDGHRWLFSTHIRDVDPADWGAKMPAKVNTKVPA